VTVSVVLAVPPAGVTIAGLRVQVMPETGEQVNATFSLNPPAGVTVSVNWVDWPTRTVAFPGVASNEKSALAMVTVTSADVLLANFPSPG